MTVTAVDGAKVASNGVRPMLDYGSVDGDFFRGIIMSTHYYWAGIDLARSIHLGERKDAGMYCWTCRRSLAVAGELGLHRATPNFLAQCPGCGLAMGWRDGDAPHGVLKVCAFTWALRPEEARMALEQEQRPVILGDDAPLTGPEFLRLIDVNCPIQFFDTGVHV